MKTTLLLTTALLAALPATGDELQRGPYLQMPSPSSMTLCWQTQTKSNSEVRYGEKPDKLDQVVRDDERELEHSVRLTGLSPATTYYYSIGDSSEKLAGGREGFHFKTEPDSTEPVRIWVIGDSGTAGLGGGRVYKVRDAHRHSALFKIPDFWLMLGDNAYHKGSEEEVTRAVFETYPKMLRTSPVWSTYGNHDTYTERGAPYFNAFRFPTKGESGGKPSGTEHYYSFDYANIHVVCLDSEGDRGEDSKMFKWLEADLKANGKTWLLAFWHLPPYSQGSHRSDTERALGEMRRNALPVLEKHNADVVFSGHSHSYERSMLIKGHYGTSDEFDVASMVVDDGSGQPGEDGTTGAYHKKNAPNSGTVYVVGGNSGKTSGGKLNHPAMKVSENKLGSLILDIEGNRLQLREIGTDGDVFDSFTIIKEKSPQKK